MTDGPIFEPEPGWGGRLNAWFHGNMLFSVALAMIIIFAIVLLIVKGMPDRRNLTTSVPLSSPSQTPVISEIVRKGDSYTLIARRMIASLNGPPRPGQALYGETVLAQKIKNQRLATGVTITIPRSLILDTLMSYESLSSFQKATWENLARNVKF